MKSSILIIYTGGTIGMKNDAETGALVPFDFSAIYDDSRRSSGSTWTSTY